MRFLFEISAKCAAYRAVFLLPIYLSERRFNREFSKMVADKFKRFKSIELFWVPSSCPAAVSKYIDRREEDKERKTEKDRERWAHSVWPVKNRQTIYKSCPKMITLAKWKIMTTLQKIA